MMTSNAEPRQNWLQRYFEESVGKVCIQWGCTTCGAREFRLGLLAALAKATDRRLPDRLFEPGWWSDELTRGHVALAKGLAGLQLPTTEPQQFEEAVRFILIELWGSIDATEKRDIDGILAGTWCGALLERMKAHHEARQVSRARHAEMHDPDRLQQQRDEKRRLRQEGHETWLALKKERDKLWRQKSEELEP